MLAGGVCGEMTISTSTGGKKTMRSNHPLSFDYISELSTVVWSEATGRAVTMKTFDVAAKKISIFNQERKKRNVLVAASVSSADTLRGRNAAKKVHILFTNLNHGRSSSLKSVPFLRRNGN